MVHMLHIFLTYVVSLIHTRELLLLSASPAFSANSKDTYTQASAHLFPALLRWLRCSDRSTVLRVVRVLGRLGSVPENVLSVDMMYPNEDLAFLVQLLCASETAVEALTTVKGQLPSHMLATPYRETSKVHASIVEDFNDFSDGKMRDVVLKTLVAFCTPYSATLKERIAAQPRCIHLIARIALRSCSKPKHDGFSKDAVSLLSSLSTEPRNRKKILPIVSSLSKAALSDESIAGKQLLCTSWLWIPWIYACVSHFVCVYLMSDDVPLRAVVCLEMMTSPAMRTVMQQQLALPLDLAAGGLATGTSSL